MDITEDTPPEPQSGETLTLVATDTATMETEQPSTSEKKREKRKQLKKKKKGGGGRKREEEEEEEGEVGGVGTGEGGKGGGDLDDLEFWLTKGDVPMQKKKVVCTESIKLMDIQVFHTFYAELYSSRDLLLGDNQPPSNKFRWSQ